MDICTTSDYWPRCSGGAGSSPASWYASWSSRSRCCRAANTGALSMRHGARSTRAVSPSTPYDVGSPGTPTHGQGSHRRLCTMTEPGPVGIRAQSGAGGGPGQPNALCSRPNRGEDMSAGRWCMLWMALVVGCSGKDSTDSTSARPKVRCARQATFPTRTVRVPPQCCAWAHVWRQPLEPGSS